MNISLKLTPEAEKAAKSVLTAIAKFASNVSEGINEAMGERKEAENAEKD